MITVAVMLENICIKYHYNIWNEILSLRNNVFCTIFVLDIFVYLYFSLSFVRLSALRDNLFIYLLFVFLFISLSLSDHHYLFICLYVCMYVFMCVHVCMYVGVCITLCVLC